MEKEILRQRQCRQQTSQGGIGLGQSKPPQCVESSPLGSRYRRVNSISVTPTSQIHQICSPLSLKSMTSGRWMAEGPCSMKQQQQRSMVGDGRSHDEALWNLTPQEEAQLQRARNTQEEAAACEERIRVGYPGNSTSVGIRNAIRTAKEDNLMSERSPSVGANCMQLPVAEMESNIEHSADTEALGLPCMDKEHLIKYRPAVSLAATYSLQSSATARVQLNQTNFPQLTASNVMSGSPCSAVSAAAQTSPNKSPSLTFSSSELLPRKQQLTRQEVPPHFEAYKRLQLPHAQQLSQQQQQNQPRGPEKHTGGPPHGGLPTISRDDIPIKANRAQRYFQQLQEEDAEFQRQRQPHAPGTQRQDRFSSRPQRNPLPRQKNTSSRTLPSERITASDSVLAQTRGAVQQKGGSVRPQAQTLGSSISSTSYLPAACLEDFASPPSSRYLSEVLLPQLQQPMARADWKVQTNALLNFRRISKYHCEILSPEILRRLVAATLTLVSSPRSSLSKNAAIALSDLFFFARGKTDPIVADVIDGCLKKSCQSVEFLAEAARGVLHSVCDFASETKSFLGFCTATANSRHQGARCVGVSCIAFLLERHRRRPPDLIPMLELLLQTSVEASSELRSASRVALRLLLETVEVGEWRQVGATPEQLRAARAAASRATHSEVDTVLQSVETCSLIDVAGLDRSHEDC